MERILKKSAITSMTVSTESGPMPLKFGDGLLEVFEDTDIGLKGWTIDLEHMEPESCEPFFQPFSNQGSFSITVELIDGSKFRGEVLLDTIQFSSGAFGRADFIGSGPMNDI